MVNIEYDVYNIPKANGNCGIVDFANKQVGGGCFGEGWVQEEQMVAQSTDFAIAVAEHKLWLNERQVGTEENIYFDTWWDKKVAMKHQPDLNDIKGKLYARITY